MWLYQCNIVVRLRQLAILFAVCALVPCTALSEEDPLFDQFSLHAQAEGEVNNDLLRVELLVQGQDKDSAALANRINADMQWALEELKRFPKVKNRTRNYRTWPKYERNQNRIIGWNASQTLSLESEDFDSARNAIQKLQERLQVNNMVMQPKPATRIAVENTLINSALNRFKERAEIVQLNMGAADYRVINININTDQQGGGYQPRMDTRAVSAEMYSAPAIEGGTSQVVVRVDGRIQLQ